MEKINGLEEIIQMTKNPIGILMSHYVGDTILIKCRNGKIYKLKRLDYPDLRFATAGLCYVSNLVEVEIEGNTIKIGEREYPHKILPVILSGFYRLYKLKACIKKIEPPTITFKYKGKQLTFELPHIFNGPCLWETFIKGSYTFFNVKNKTILDIGAFIGDTSIYFAINGAKKVLAYEPSPNNFRCLSKNVELNNMKNKIVPQNMGIGGREGEYILYENEIVGGISSSINVTEHSKPVKIKVVDISKLLENVDIVKIDCEGCEYEVLERMIETNAFPREGIIGEFHSVGGYEIEPFIKKFSESTKASYKVLEDSEKTKIIAIWW